MRPLLRLVDGLSTACAWIASALALVLIVVTLFEVFMRYVFGTPTIWVFDVAYMVSGASVLLAGGHTLRTDGHVRIDFVSSRFSPRVQALVQAAFFALVILPALYLITAASWRKTWTAFLRGEVEAVSPWAPVIWPFYTALTVGLVALFLQVAAQLARNLVLAISPTDHPRPEGAL